MQARKEQLEWARPGPGHGGGESVAGVAVRVIHADEEGPAGGWEAADGVFGEGQVEGVGEVEAADVDEAGDAENDVEDVVVWVLRELEVVPVGAEGWGWRVGVLDE